MGEGKPATELAWSEECWSEHSTLLPAPSPCRRLLRREPDPGQAGIAPAPARRGGAGRCAPRRVPLAPLHRLVDSKGGESGGPRRRSGTALYEEALQAVPVGPTGTTGRARAAEATLDACTSLHRRPQDPQGDRWL